MPPRMMNGAPSAQMPRTNAFPNCWNENRCPCSKLWRFAYQTTYTAMIAVYVVWYAKRHNFEHGHRFSFQQFGKAFVRGIWALGAPFIILGGIYGGVFSPTEAAAVACVYAALVTWLGFRELSWRDVLDAAGTTPLFTGQVLIIVACASVFAWLLTVNQGPAAMR